MQKGLTVDAIGSDALPLRRETDARNEVIVAVGGAFAEAAKSAVTKRPDEVVEESVEPFNSEALENLNDVERACLESMKKDFDRGIVLVDPRDEDGNLIAMNDVAFKGALEKDKTAGQSWETVQGRLLANEAALLAAKYNKTKIDQKEFLESIEKVMLGPERRSHILSKNEKEIAAYHEAGHALVSTFMPGTEPVRKISIIARGMAAGYTLQVPSEEKKMKTRTSFISEIATLLGGLTAERIIFGEMTTGASNDLVRASELARRLVKEYGMSSLGPITFGEKEELVFLGKEISEQRNYSEKIATRIDEEVSIIIKEAQKKAEQILIKKQNLLEKVAKALIEKEIIEMDEYEALVRGKK